MLLSISKSKLIPRLSPGLTRQFIVCGLYYTSAAAAELTNPVGRRAQSHHAEMSSSAIAGPPVPIYDPSESRVITIVAIVAFVLTIAATAVALRVYTRICVLKQFGIDDWAAIVTFVSRVPPPDESRPARRADLELGSYSS